MGMVGNLVTISSVMRRLSLLYFVLLAAVAVSVWAFFQADRQHEQTIRVLHESYEIQWRAAQIRERLTGVVAELEISLATGSDLPRISRDIRYLAHNVRQTVALDYITKYLAAADINKLTNALNIIETTVVPATQGPNKDFRLALQQLRTLVSDMFRVSNAALEHMTAYTISARSEEDARRLSFILATAFATIVLLAVAVTWQSRFANWKEQHLRSFANLFAHSTTSLISGIRFFLDDLSDGEIPDKGTIDKAKTAAGDLERLNARMHDIAATYDQRKGRRGHDLTKFATLLSELIRTIERNDLIKLEVTDDALQARIPGSQFHVILRELIRNAQVAMDGQSEPTITIKGAIKRYWFGWSRRLLVSVEDNGRGMTDNVRKNALNPFFSTRGGSHTGMGLASTVDLVKCFHGQLWLNSVSGHGTTVKFDYPLG